MLEIKEKESKVARFAKGYEGMKTLRIAGILDIVGTAIAALIVLVSVIQMGGFGGKDDISSQQVAEAMGGGSIFIILGFGSMILAIVDCCGNDCFCGRCIFQRLGWLCAFTYSKSS